MADAQTLPLTSATAGCWIPAPAQNEVVLAHAPIYWTSIRLDPLRILWRIGEADLGAFTQLSANDRAKAKQRLLGSQPRGWQLGTILGLGFMTAHRSLNVLVSTRYSVLRTHTHVNGGQHIQASQHKTETRKCVGREGSRQELASVLHSAMFPTHG